MSADGHDCLILGAGPAGLVAAIYLARFRRTVALLDQGDSRVNLIARTHNTPGFAGGIDGPTLLARLREQAEAHGVMPLAAEVRALVRVEGGFRADYAGLAEGQGAASLRARTVLLATGVRDRLPPFPDALEATRAGYLRHCPICDGYEAIDLALGVLGNGLHAAREALFLRGFTRRVTVLTDGTPLAGEARTLLAGTGQDIAVEESALAGLARAGGRFVGVRTAAGASLAFDALYTALGARCRSELARALGACCDAEGGVVVDAHCRTDVPGLYAAGDVCSALNQIAVAMGHAAIAATDIHNALTHARLPSR